jgi:hypothetical protein
MSSWRRRLFGGGDLLWRNIIHRETCDASTAYQKVNVSNFEQIIARSSSYSRVTKGSGERSDAPPHERL